MQDELADQNNDYERIFNGDNSDFYKQDITNGEKFKYNQDKVEDSEIQSLDVAHFSFFDNELHLNDEKEEPSTMPACGQISKNFREGSCTNQQTNPTEVKTVEQGSLNEVFCIPKTVKSKKASTQEGKFKTRSDVVNKAIIRMTKKFFTDALDCENKKCEFFTRLEDKEVQEVLAGIDEV